MTIMEQIKVVFHYFVWNYNASAATAELLEITGMQSIHSVTGLFK